jgi:phosphotransferase system  glucose/maltose/N-acetylglucosamine-specific IIC component
MKKMILPLILILVLGIFVGLNQQISNSYFNIRFINENKDINQADLDFGDFSQYGRPVGDKSN